MKNLITTCQQWRQRCTLFFRQRHAQRIDVHNHVGPRVHIVSHRDISCCENIIMLKWYIHVLIVYRSLVSGISRCIDSNRDTLYVSYKATINWSVHVLNEAVIMQSTIATDYERVSCGRTLSLAAWRHNVKMSSLDCTHTQHARVANDNNGQCQKGKQLYMYNCLHWTTLVSCWIDDNCNRVQKPPSPHSTLRCLQTL